MRQTLTCHGSLYIGGTLRVIALRLKSLADDVRTRTVRNGTGEVELRTRVESNETKLLLVTKDGSGPL